MIREKTWRHNVSQIAIIIVIALCVLTLTASGSAESGADASSGVGAVDGAASSREADAQAKEDPWATLKLPGYENTVRGVTGPDGQVISGYTWEMYARDRKERTKDGIRVKIEMYQIDFPDQKPLIKEGRMLIPMRPVLESERVQCRVYWNDEAKEATVLDQRGRKTVFAPDKKSYSVIYPDGATKSYPLDVPASIIEGRVFLPMRVLLENFAFKVDWDELEQCVYVWETHPSWRKLLPASQWKKSLEEDCLPCLMGTVKQP